MSQAGDPSKPPGGGNRLRAEKSPYLLQHASNPVDWFPWGAEAFAKAGAADKPIFLSIGYSTCHWCHVMAHESFEDAEVAGLMNAAFVNVKVDREERPDLDHVYMMVCQMMTGSGGWPLSIIMTPDGKPFFATTYIPRDNRFGRVGMLELVPRVAEFWKADRASAQAAADRIAELLSEAFGGAAVGAAGARGDASAGPVAASAAYLTTAGPTAIAEAYRLLAAAFDKRNGGFGGAPKFPAPQNLFFLLRYWKRTGDPEVLGMVELTLRMMRRGGIYDQLGFGFHRYSTGEGWLVPHFEKMLYDQALLAIAYLEAFQATGNPGYRETAEEVLGYVERDLMSEEGAFYSAEDADTEGEEGKFYLWDAADLRSLLGDEDADLAARYYAIEGRPIEGRGDAAGQPGGGPCSAGVLHAPRPVGEVAREVGMAEAELAVRLGKIRGALFAARKLRARPLRDDKVLADWNGLMIAAYARASEVLDEPRYLAIAARAAGAVLARLRPDGGRLLHRWRDGEAATAGNLDDYAFMIWGLVELYEASFEAKYLSAALELSTAMLDHFWDRAGCGLFFTPDDGPQLLARPRVTNDGAIPSGNSVALLDLLRLARIAGDPGLEAKASALAAGLAGIALESPSAHVHLLAAMDFALAPAVEVVVVGRAEAADTAAMLRALRSRFLPNKVVLLVEPGGDASGIGRIASYTAGLTAAGDNATAYVCRNFVCELPTTDVGEMLRLVDAAPEPPRAGRL